MSQTTTTGRPSPTGACGNLYDTPVRDAVCAMPYKDAHIGYMSACCGDAEVISYYDDCGLYCLAEGQSVEALTACLYDEGAEWEDVFCRGSEKATATGDGKPLPSSEARVLDDDEREEASNDDDDEDRNNKDDNNDDNNDDEYNDDDESAAPKSVKAPITVAGVFTGALLLFGTMSWL